MESAVVLQLAVMYKKTSWHKNFGKTWFYDMVQPMGNKKVGCSVILVPLLVQCDVVGSATILVFILMSVPY